MCDRYPNHLWLSVVAGQSLLKSHQYSGGQERAGQEPIVAVSAYITAFSTIRCHKYQEQAVLLHRQCDIEIYIVCYITEFCVIITYREVHMYIEALHNSSVASSHGNMKITQ